NQNPNCHIAVHCTHGFNRTGFLICSYLVLVHKWDMEQAVHEFAKARPPGIYKQDYIDELFRRYDYFERRFAAPELPKWCNEDEQYQDDDSVVDVRNGGYAGPSTSRNISSHHDNSSNSASNPFEGVYLVRDQHKIEQ